MSTELFTTNSLGSFAGLVAATYLLVSFFKEPVKQHLGDWWVRILAVLIAFVIQLFVLYVGKQFKVESIGLALLNSFLIAIAAAGTHEITQSSATPRPQEVQSVSPTPKKDPLDPSEQNKTTEQQQ